MESNAMTWNEVAASIIDDDRGKWDRKLPAASLLIGQNGQLVTMNGGPAPEPYVLSELATGQLCERLGIPATYYRRLPPEMKATVANFDLKRMSERPFLLRGKGAHVRAVLSGEYVAYNNSAIAETVESLLRSEGLRIKSFVLEPGRKPDPRCLPADQERSRSRSARRHQEDRGAASHEPEAHRRGGGPLRGRARAESVRRDQRVHRRGADARAAPANRNGTLCRHPAGGIALNTQKASITLAFFFVRRGGANGRRSQGSPRSRCPKERMPPGTTPRTGIRRQASLRPRASSAQMTLAIRDLNGTWGEAPMVTSPRPTSLTATARV